MSKTTFIDMVFVVALLNQRDQYHQRAEELAGQYEGRRFLITDGVLLEIGNALARNYKEQAVEVIEHFFSSEDVEVVRLTPALFEEAFALYKTYRDKEWGLVDCISFVVMRQAGVEEALTFDQHFVQAGFRALMRE
ncbi:MAG TPA: PIN domain-containing protein [Gemmataceae bacterium]|nr:PIN domain-containing protein [Gemmataceae bacterium]